MDKYRENLEARAKLLIHCEDPKYRAMVLENCKRDILFWFEYFAYTDKNSGFFGQDVAPQVPFILFEYQKDFVTDLWDAIMEGNKPISERTTPTNVFIEKSRQMGLSWLIVGVFVYGFIFHNQKFLAISQKQDDVDKSGDIKSLFEKMRFMIRLMPKWMLPQGLTKEVGTEHNKQMSLTRSDGTGSITGESANPNASRGGTYNAIFMDEMASMQNASQINTAASRATPCRIFNSTPNGKGNEYYKMKLLAEEGAFRWHRIHWSEHPYYTTEWYNKQKAGMTPEQVAQELDINYNASVIGRVYPEFRDETYSIEYDESKPLYISIDNSHGGSDPHAIIVCQPDGHYWNIIDYLEINCSVTDIAKLLAKKPQMALTDSANSFYNRYINYKPAIFVADPYDTHSTLNTTTIYQEYSNVGLFLNTNIIKEKKEQIMRTRANIYRYRMSENCIDLVNVIANARYPEVKENSNSTQPKDKPVHDWTSHGRSALEYLTCFLLENDKLSVKEEKTKIPVKNHLTGEIEFRYV